MAIEYYLPEQIITNDDLKKSFPDWDSSTFEQKVGIRSRHIALETETAVDLAEKAALKVLANTDVSSIDFLLLCTQSPDYFLPTSACVLQNRLNLPQKCGALDFNLGCSGYIYGLALAKGLLNSGIAKKILLIMSETYSKHIHVNDRVNRAIFGDGASATIISDDSFKIGEFVLKTDGSGANELIVKNGGFRSPYNPHAVEYEYGTGNITSDNHLYMNGPSIFNFTISQIPKLVTETAVVNNIDLNDINYFIFHQANKFMLEYLRKKIKLESSKFCIDLLETGNTVSSTIPISLKIAIDEGKVKKGYKVMLVGFGVGLSLGATIITL